MTKKEEKKKAQVLPIKSEDVELERFTEVSRIKLCSDDMKLINVTGEMTHVISGKKYPVRKQSKKKDK